ncbi:hypothetical protein BS50DRAFT_596769 [Corynespora cassiicola Philippines]|uniref:Zn(2)-C6 fungal-type domain-containing protein n=1 Tax=Corynespora cassiicola Philippines TaxID=1448308 RepID=A0A2T2P5W1_CORCC|nr:hypothetical protein BS50DRAFT_596769 [Corynespora cassiicola Philippines]
MAPPGSNTHLHNACINCKSRKIRCSGEQPCLSCGRHGRACVYQPLKPRGRKRKDFSSNPTPGSPIHTSPGPLAAKRLEQLRTGVTIRQPGTGAVQFYGPASHISFMYAFYRRIHRNPNASDSEEAFRAMQEWGLDKFTFPLRTITHTVPSALQACLCREKCVSFIDTFFNVCHPQYPFLVRKEVERQWERLWEPPEPEGDIYDQNMFTSRSIVMMVLAIGASMSGSSPERDSKLIERWVSHLASQAQLRDFAFVDTSLSGVRLLLLKSILAIQQMRLNEAHLFASHAAANANALGMNRAQVANGSHPEMHRCRITFWTLYSTERLVTLCTGRPSSIREESIDVSLPECLPSSEGDETTNLAYVHATAALAKTADRINDGIYLTARNCAAPLEQIAIECDAELDNTMQRLPSFLHFFDADMPPSPHTWQEVQRISLGLNYYHCRILMYRPLAHLATLYSTNEEALAEAKALGIRDMQHGISQATSAAKSLIDLAITALDNRVPIMRQDSGVAYNIIGACLTLLYRLFHGTTRVSSSEVTDIFRVVQDGIRCLDYMGNLGPKFGRTTLSERILSAAKDAFKSAQEEAGDLRALHDQGDHSAENQETTFDLDPDLLLAQFPWLGSAVPSVHESDSIPTPLTSVNENGHLNTGMSSGDLYSIFFSPAPPIDGSTESNMYNLGVYPWSHSSGRDLGRYSENGGNGSL